MNELITIIKPYVESIDTAILTQLERYIEHERRSAAEAMRERCRLIAEEEMDGYTKQSNPGYLEARNIAKRIDELPLDSDGEA